MKIYDGCFKVLRTVLKENVFFATALKKNIQGHSKEDLSKISSLCGVFLRNYFLIKAVANLAFKTDDVEPLIYIGLVYINNSYKKMLDTVESEKYLKQKLALYEIKFEGESKDMFDEAVKDKVQFLRNYLGKKRLNFVSARNNLPVWVVKGLMTQYGDVDKNIPLKTIAAMTKMPKQFAVTNKLLPAEEGKDIYDGFKRVEEEFLEFNATTSIRKNPAVRNGNILPIQEAEYKFVQALPELKNAKVAMYFEEKNGIYAAFSNKFIENNQVSLLSPNPKNNPELFTRIQMNKPKNLGVYESDENCIITHIPEDQDLVVFMPRSSNLEQLRRNAEYGILFNTSLLDDIILNENAGLDDITRYVKPAGYLAYAVPTFNLKETLVVGKKFLENHKDFEFVKEKVFFPYEKENSVFYYIIFRKKNND